MSDVGQSDILRRMVVIQEAIGGYKERIRFQCEEIARLEGQCRIRLDLMDKLIERCEAIVDSTSTATLDSRVEDLLGAVESAKREVRGET